MSERVQAHLLALRRGYEAGVERYGELGLAFDAYAEEALEAVDRRLASMSLEPSPERVDDALGRMAVADLYLARACNVGAVDAWAALTKHFTPRLSGLARKRGARGSAADELVSALLADLTLPPPKSRARTLIGTYGGAGSLFGWLSVILVRRMAGEARKKRPTSLDNRPSDEQDVLTRPRRTEATTNPADAALDQETRERVDTALRAAWEACTPKERLALLFKYRDGLAQRRMAQILEVGEPRVSRLVKQALAKLAAAVADHLPEGLREDAMAAAAESVGEALTTLGAAEPPPHADGPPPDGSAAGPSGERDP
ncbi:MAG: sigma-70 family RNA polymerase sigma factor [Planctomycetota bacterium]|nr:sigma-70 family RNA polymerase sigma factor [Planctomycetota bacterium]